MRALVEFPARRLRLVKGEKGRPGSEDVALRADSLVRVIRPAGSLPSPRTVPPDAVLLRRSCKANGRRFGRQPVFVEHLTTLELWCCRPAATGLTRRRTPKKCQQLRREVLCWDAEAEPTSAAGALAAQADGTWSRRWAGPPAFIRDRPAVPQTAGSHPAAPAPTRGLCGCCENILHEGPGEGTPFSTLDTWAV